MFAQWKDNNKLLVDYDYHRWKLHRFVKKEQDRTDIMAYLDENLDMFKEIYANVQSASNEYPGISSLGFRDFCYKSRFIDKQFHASAADRLFIAANYDLDYNEGDQNVASQLIRYEFLEILVRVAKHKFIETNKCSNYKVALGAMFSQIKKEYPLLGWNRWRNQVLWEVELNDMLARNQDNLKVIFEMFSRNPKHKRLTMPELREWMCSEKVPELCMISERECQLLFGMSKMPVKDEENKLD